MPNKTDREKAEMLRYLADCLGVNLDAIAERGQTATARASDNSLFARVSNSGPTNVIVQSNDDNFCVSIERCDREPYILGAPKGAKYRIIVIGGINEPGRRIAQNEHTFPWIYAGPKGILLESYHEKAYRASHEKAYRARHKSRRARSSAGTTC